MNKQLMTIVLESAAFWELADDLVDPDAAEEQIEGIISTLSQLTADEKAELIAFASEYADEEAKSGGPSERARYFRTVGSSLRLSA